MGCGFIYFNTSVVLHNFLVKYQLTQNLFAQECVGWPLVWGAGPQDPGLASPHQVSWTSQLRASRVEGAALLPAAPSPAPRFLSPATCWPRSPHSREFLSYCLGFHACQLGWALKCPLVSPVATTHNSCPSQIWEKLNSFQSSGPAPSGCYLHTFCDQFGFL